MDGNNNRKGQRATEAALGSLHGALAQAFIDRIQSGEASPSDLNAARQFLKDNGISCVPEENTDIQQLVAAIPTTDELDILTLGGIEDVTSPTRQ